MNGFYLLGFAFAFGLRCVLRWRDARQAKPLPRPISLPPSADDPNH